MLRLIAKTHIKHAPDVELFRTSFGYAVRYGLQVTGHTPLDEALKAYGECVAHALACAGHGTESADTEGQV